jgi:hypothetical protein
MKDDVAHKAASRLLRSVVVQRVIDEEECKYIAKKRLEKDMVVLQLQRVYTKAMADRDYASANSALDKLMKHFGMFDKHNKQKKYGPDEVAAIRSKLEAQGVMFAETNKPVMIENTPIGLNENVQDAEIVKQEGE